MADTFDVAIPKVTGLTEACDSSTVTFLQPPNTPTTFDFEVRFTDIADFGTVLASSGTISAPIGARKLVTLQPKTGGGVEVVVTDEP